MRISNWSSDVCSADLADAEVVQDAAPLPIGSLFALALAAFVTILTEALHAGLLSQISEGLAISEALAGQLVTVYAIGPLLRSAERRVGNVCVRKCRSRWIRSQLNIKHTT